MKALKYLIFIFLFESCLPDPIPIDVDQAPTRLVVSSQYFPGQGMSVLVTKSFSALEDRAIEGSGVGTLNIYNDLLVTSAQVWVYYKDQQVRLDHTTTGIYIGLLPGLELGNTVQLKIYDPETGLSVESSTVVMPTVGLAEATLTREFTDGNTYNIVDYRIDDPAGPNWYALNFYREPADEPDYRQGFTEFEIFNTETVFISPQDPVSGTKRLFEWEENEIGVAVFNLTEEHFYYLERLQKAGQAVPFVTEPANLTGNVTPGYGFFSAQFPWLGSIRRRR